MVKTYVKKSDAGDLKKLILKAFESGKDWKSLAETLGIKKSTLYRWINSKQSVDKRGGPHNKKIQENHKEFLIRKIEENPRITLADLSIELERVHELKVTSQCIGKQLDGLLYSLKAIRLIPENANSDINKQKRKDFIEQLLRYQSEQIPILWMDESNFNLHISRSEGRSVKGERCQVAAAGSKGSNVHLIGCISTFGWVLIETKRGAFKKEEAHSWVKRCLLKANEIFKVPVVLVIDNAPAHSSVETILESSEIGDNKILRLGPYSPMLNPIERVWSMIKAEVKKKMAEKMPNILSNTSEDVSIRELRTRILESEINNALNLITPGVCNKFIASIQTFFSKIINLEDINF